MKIKKFLGKIELRKIFALLTGIVFFLLVLISVLGVRQYLLYRHCREMITRSDHIIFQFTSIKEHINDSLLVGKKFNIQETSLELLGFDDDLKEIIDDSLIPEEFKLTFVSRVDLMNLVVQLRALQDDSASSSVSRQHAQQLSTSLRSISNRLFTFHNILADYTRSLLLGLYKVIIGILALAFFCTSFILLLMNKFIVDPIVRICSMTNEHGGEQRGKRRKSNIFSVSIQSLTSFITLEQAHERQMEHLQNCLEQLLQTLPDSFGNEKDWRKLCTVLQTNPDYFLVWVGRKTGNDNFPVPIAGCGCRSGPSTSCLQELEHVFDSSVNGHGLGTTAKKAMKQGRVVSAPISGERIPRSLCKPPIDDNASIASASFPLAGPTGASDTVLTIYSQKESFSILEISILQLLCKYISCLRRQPAVEASLPATVTTDIYRWSVAGKLSASLARELINLSNGALNYSQALLDLFADDQKKGEEHMLLEKLHDEEVKISRLTSDFNKLAGLDSLSSGNVTIEQLFAGIEHLFQGRFRQQHIKLFMTQEQDTAGAIVAATPLYIVILTLLHAAETYILTQEAENRQERISLAATVSKIEPPELRLNISPLRVDVETDMQTGPWPSMAMCYDMMRTVQSALAIHSHTDAPYLSATLSVPLQRK
jgi:hypothetical protein